MNYEDFLFKVPVESSDYRENSDFVIQQIESIIQDAIDSQRNKIFINTNLRLGLPMENINKIAGPFVEAWAFEVFYEEFQKQQSEYDLVNVETMTRLNMADVVLQFKKRSTAVVANVDVKATSKDIERSGKSPNITSYSRIRTAYVKDPDFMFVILSLKHKVYSDRNIATGLMDGVMEVVDFNAYDLKYISALDIYNNNFKSEEIRDKIALIGTSAAALMDLRATPFESIFPGVEVHANVIDNILNKDFLFKPSWIEAINICLIFVLSFFIYFIIRKVPIILTPIFIFISLYLIFYINYFILFKYGLVINTLFPFITIILSSAVSLVIGYFYEIKKKEEIKLKFASKVSKSVMEELIKDVDNNHLKVQNKEITIFFSDIREFTQISEKLDSAEIVIDYLNKYLTPMSEIINKYDGTIDKYIGDCIMAYWNAPFDIKNHADKALKSAIQQLNILKDLL